MSNPKTLVIATRNKGKLKEIKQIFSLDGWRVAGLDDYPQIGEIPEDGATFEENALIKARSVFKATGLPAVGDDSGIEVAALDGKPGVYSARFAGKNATDAENNSKLIQSLKGVPAEKRSAKFVCVMAIVAPTGIEKSVRGECDGVVIDELRGNAGFGYDPLFYYPPMRKTYAEMNPTEKNAVSHRSRALYKLMEILPGILSAI